MVWRFCSAVAILSVCLVARAEMVTISPGYLTGNSYNRYTRDDRVMYLMGVLDGMMLGPAFNAPKKDMLWIEACTKGKESGQVLAIVDKWLTDHPGEWQYPMHTLVWQAFRDICPKR